MTRLVKMTLFIAAAVLALTARVASAEINVSVTIGGFYDELSPYGRWVGCRYGECWIPERVSQDWQPYSNGQWIYTEYGWTWVSNDPWGGSPYHYGAWTWINAYGWSWVPGTTWAPAWVTWSYSNDYVGWAPLPPTVAFDTSGYSGRPVVVNRSQYVFVPTNVFVGRNVSSVRLPASESVRIFRQTKAVTAFAVSGGILRNDALPVAMIERAAGARIERRNVSAAGTAPREAAARSGRFSVVAPAREVRAAAASRSKGASRPPVTAREKNETRNAPERQPEVVQPRGAHPTPPARSPRPVVEAPARRVDSPSERQVGTSMPATGDVKPKERAKKVRAAPKEPKPDGAKQR